LEKSTHAFGEAISKTLNFTTYSYTFEGIGIL
jgi:hypothetical protein